MAKKTLEDIDVKGKKVFVRADFNVPLDENQNITNDKRIRATLPTIEYLLKQGAAVILASHLGRPKGKIVPEMSTKPVAARLSELLGKPVAFATDCVGAPATEAAAKLQPGEVLLLENLRFHPEEKCWDLVSSNLEDAEPPKHDRVLQLVRDFTEEKEEWIGTAAELLQELKTRTSSLDLTANVLIRIMNANRTMLKNYYKVAYQILPKRNNVKRISLQFLVDVIVSDPGETDRSDTSDMSDNIGHIALIGRIGQKEVS